MTDPVEPTRRAADHGPGSGQDYDPDLDPALRPDPFGSRTELRVNRIDRRRAKIVDDVRRAREGRNRIPTWVLVTIFLVVVAAYVILIALA